MHVHVNKLDNCTCIVVYIHIYTVGVAVSRVAFYYTYTPSDVMFYSNQALLRMFRNYFIFIFREFVRKM